MSGHHPPSDMTDRDHVDGVPLPQVSDGTMRERIATAQPYTAMLLRKTAKYKRPEVDLIVWEHGRRNMALIDHGVLAIVLPVNNDPGNWAGLGIFTAGLKETGEIMDHDPGVKAGVFTYELHPVNGFPSSSLA